MSLPMYDWPEERARTDREWAQWRDALRAHGVPAPARLTRCNADLAPVPGGIRDSHGAVIAAAPESRPGESLDLDVLWRHPDLLLAQTCWGPLQRGLAPHVRVLAQPDYSAFAGGNGIHYRSALVVRGDPASDVLPPAGRTPLLPVARLGGQRLVRSKADSMSGAMALSADLSAAGVDEVTLWAAATCSGSHRQSMIAVAEGRADVAAIDCRSLHLARRHERAARALRVIGWTAPRPGLPLITGRATPRDAAAIMRTVLGGLAGLHPA